MVMRKSSLPFPASPPPPAAEPLTSQSHLHVNSEDVPPIPSSIQRSNGSSMFEEMGNPWQDDYSPRRNEATHDIPELLKPGSGRPGPRMELPKQEHPDVLRPGWSGEATPRSSLDSDRSPEKEEKDWWDDDEDEQKDPTDPEVKGSRELHVVNDTASPSEAAVLPSPGVKRKPVPTSPLPHSSAFPARETTTSPPFAAAALAVSPGREWNRRPSSPSARAQPDLASNNPYRRPSETLSAESMSDMKGKARDQHPHPLRSSPSTDHLGRLALDDRHEEKQALPQIPSFAPPPPPMQAPPPIPILQEPLQPTHIGDSQQSWSFQRPIPSPSSSFAPSNQHVTHFTNDLLDRGENDGSLLLQDELKAIPNNPTAPEPAIQPEVSLLEEEEPLPPKPPRPVRQESAEMYLPPPGPPPGYISTSHAPPVKPPRPAVVTSEHDLARMREQRNETYQIKHFNWFDMRTSKMRRSSMLTQNKNGPCPLLALVNALILGATEEMQAALDDALRLREQVSLGLIIETLMDELISRAALMEGLQLPDVDELNRFLMRLRTGMNANPRFVPASKSAPNLMDVDTPTTSTAQQPQTLAGTFEPTQDIKLYSSFKVKLLHGWLPQPGDSAAVAFARSAQTYEDAQAVQFGEEELEYKLSSGGLTEQEQQVWEDITSIKQFFQAYSTQLTPYGLGTIKGALEPGEFAILFRNDHFSSIYMNPRDQRLYTLVTDAGFADRDEIIWESLEDISGARTEYFSGDFQPVSHGDTSHPMPHSMTSAANPGSSRNQLAPNYDFGDPGMTPQQQEQADMDFALALQMQEEEEQAQRRSRAQSQANRGGPSNTPNRGARRSQGNIPIPLRSNPGGEVRPIIPPRNQNTNRNQAVNRPADADQADAPPAYEEAATQRPYIPPIGSPLHPSSSTDLPLGRATTSTSSVNAQGQTTGVTQSPMYRAASYGGVDARPGPRHTRRTSAYGDNNQAWTSDHSAGAFGPSYAFLSPSGADAGRRRTSDGRIDRDCTVM